MAVKTLELSESQHLLWDKMMDERAITAEREKRVLKACLLELGGRLNEPWQFDEVTRRFWINIPDEQPTASGVDAAGIRETR